MQDIEAQKQQLLVGNEEKTEHRLKKTKDDGVILMSIKSMW